MLMCTNSSFMGCCGNGSHVIGSLGFFAGKNDGSCADYPSSNVSITRGAWSHVAVAVKSLSSGKMVSFSSTAAAGTYEDADYVIGNGGGLAPLTLGGISGCSSGTCLPFDGHMDNIRVWSEALSTQAIRDSEFGDGTLRARTSFLVAEYLFDEGAIDSHDGEHDLSIDPLEYATVVLDDAVYKEISTRAPGSILFGRAPTPW